MKFNLFSVAVLAFASSASYGQSQAVQWRVEDGGNGHWYRVVVVSGGLSWTNAKATASSRGGYLASIRSTAESTFVKSIISATPGAFSGQAGGFEVGPWIGGSRILGTNGWQWMSSEAWSFTSWCAGEPNGGSGEPYVHFFRNGSTLCWNDRENFAYSTGNPSFILETHTKPEGPTDTVQWPASQGGNDHWYELVVFSTATDWQTAKAQAEARGGHLATVTSATENSWVFNNIAQYADGWWCGLDCYGPWLGGYQDRTAADFSEPGGGWRWITGETWSYTAWEPNLPNNAVPLQDYLHFYGPASPTTFFTPAAFWDDIGSDGPASSMVVEYDADCNNDGIVDYGQIRNGQLVDANSNGVPDTCECFADINNSGGVNGVDLAIVLGAWGTSGQADGDADINDDGVVNGQDLAFVLGAWGPCP